MAAWSHLQQQLGTRGELATGDTHVLTFGLTEDGAAVEPTVSSAEFNLKTALTVADASSTVQKTLGSGIAVSGSTVTVTIAASDTSSLTADTTYFWALKIKESDNTVTTVAAGTITFRATAALAL